MSQNHLSQQLRTKRIEKEVKLLSESPPPGICCYSKSDSLLDFEASIVGTEGTPYQSGIFKLNLLIPQNYPFEAPKVRFITPIYHPNIDSAGRICLDILETKGWKPSLNLSTVLMSIQLLMNEPNPDDPLMPEISEEFRYSRELFETKAREHTALFASGSSILPNCSKQPKSADAICQPTKQTSEKRTLELENHSKKKLKLSQSN